MTERYERSPGPEQAMEESTQSGRPVIGVDAPSPVEREVGPLGKSLAPPLVAFGLVLVGVGLVDLGIAWLPWRFGVPEWEFGTAARTFDSLALGTTGLVFLVISASVSGRWSALKVLAGLSALGLVLLAVAFALYLVNLPVALQGVPEQTRSVLERSMVRTTAFALMYVALYGWMTWFSWRRSGAGQGVGR